MISQNKPYISLKDASELSGYSPDYIGQLIRSGKLPGKQVFQQAVWMTTEADVREYMRAKKAGSSRQQTRNTGFGALRARWRTVMELPRVMTVVLYAAIALSICLFLFLFYAFSSSLNQRLEQNAIEQVNASSTL